MTDKPAVLIVPPHLAPVGAFLESAYTVYRLWEGPPVEATRQIRAAVVAGDVAIPEAVWNLPQLGLLACFTAGYDAIDVPAARARGLEVTHAPNVNDQDVADHALAMILAQTRQLFAGDRAVRSGAWTANARTLTGSMGGLRLGIVGLGGIGRALAERAQACRMDVRWWGPRPKPDAPWPRAESLVALARDCDVLAVCCKADDGNRGLISAEVIEALGSSGMLVNVSRGSVVDEDALIAALKSGRLGAAGLDVFAAEPTPPERWADVPNVILTPHTAGATTAAVQRMVGMLLANLDAYFAGRPVPTPAS